MDKDTMKHMEKLDADYWKIASQEAWEPKDVVLMKDLQKLMYYIEVREAMRNGEMTDMWQGEEDYGSGHSYRSYARGGGGGSGTNMSGRRYYDGRSYDNRGWGSYGGGSYTRGGGGGNSGNRYYDSEVDMAITKLHGMMDSTNDPEIRRCIQDVIGKLEMK